MKLFGLLRRLEHHPIWLILGHELAMDSGKLLKLPEWTIELITCGTMEDVNFEHKKSPEFIRGFLCRVLNLGRSADCYFRDTT